MGPSLRTIQDRLANADGSAVAGTIEVSWSPGVTGDGFTIAGGKLLLRLSAGSFNVSLAPGTYQVKYALARGAQRSETWVVPTAPGPFRIVQVKQ